MSAWMMIKLLGSAFLFSSCVLAGLGSGRRARRRTVLLSEMARFLARIRTELLYRRERSLTLLRRALSAEKMQELTLDFSHGDSAPCAVEAAMRMFCQRTDDLLTAQEQCVFADALRCVGAQDASEQSEQLQYAETVLENAKKQAEKKAADEIRIFRTLGICAGCAAVLFLL